MLGHTIGGRYKLRGCAVDAVDQPAGVESDPDIGRSQSRNQSSILRVLLFLLLLAGTSIAYAENVRGRIDFQDYHGYYSPLPDIPVTVWSHDYQQRSLPVYTGPDGMYYIYDIPPGPYRLELWVYRNQEPVTREIFIRSEQYMTDIPPFVARW